MVLLFIITQSFTLNGLSDALSTEYSITTEPWDFPLFLVRSSVINLQPARYCIVPVGVGVPTWGGGQVSQDLQIFAPDGAG